MDARRQALKDALMKLMCRVFDEIAGTAHVPSTYEEEVDDFINNLSDFLGFE